MNNDIIRAIKQVAHKAEQEKRAADIETYIRDVVSKVSLDVRVVLFQCIDHIAVNFGMKWADSKEKRDGADTFRRSRSCTKC